MAYGNQDPGTSCAQDCRSADHSLALVPVASGLIGLSAQWSPGAAGPCRDRVGCSGRPWLMSIGTIMTRSSSATHTLFVLEHCRSNKVCKSLGSCACAMKDDLPESRDCSGHSGMAQTRTAVTSSTLSPHSGFASNGCEIIVAIIQCGSN